MHPSLDSESSGLMPSSLSSPLSPEHTSLDDLCQGLERLDKLWGLPYGGSAIVAKQSSRNFPKKPTILGTVAAVQDQDNSPTEFTMHKEPWFGAVNLPEDLVKQLRQMFKCVQCRSNDHTLPSCPLMKNWIIKNKSRNDNNADSDSHAHHVGGVNSVLAPSSSPEHDSAIILPPITEDIDENSSDDHFG